jgi:hypothetical protein
MMNFLNSKTVKWIFIWGLHDLAGTSSSPLKVMLTKQNSLYLKVYAMHNTFWATIITINCYLLDLLHGISLTHRPTFLASDMPRHILFGTTYTAFHSNFPLLKRLPIKWKQHSMALLYRIRIPTLLRLPCQTLMNK